MIILINDNCLYEYLFNFLYTLYKNIQGKKLKEKHIIEFYK